jgi:hypothetical protein
MLEGVCLFSFHVYYYLLFLSTLNISEDPSLLPSKQLGNVQILLSPTKHTQAPTTLTTNKRRNPFYSAAAPLIKLPWLTRGERRIPELDPSPGQRSTQSRRPRTFPRTTTRTMRIGSDMLFASPAGGPMRLHAHPRVRKYLDWRSDIMTLVRRIVFPVQGLVLLRSGPRGRAAQGLNRLARYLFVDI